MVTAMLDGPNHFVDSRALNDIFNKLAENNVRTIDISLMRNAISKKVMDDDTQPVRLFQTITKDEMLRQLHRLVLNLNERVEKLETQRDNSKSRKSSRRGSQAKGTSRHDKDAARSGSIKQVRA